MTSTHRARWQHSLISCARRIGGWMRRRAPGRSSGPRGYGLVRCSTWRGRPVEGTSRLTRAWYSRKTHPAGARPRGARWGKTAGWEAEGATWWKDRRGEAKRSRNFKLADEIRDRLKASGFEIRDTKEGSE